MANYADILNVICL